MRTRAKWKFVAKATALGARVPQVELFVLAAEELTLPRSGANIFIRILNRRKTIWIRKEYVPVWWEPARSVTSI